jgi:hypothetical protein
MLLERPEKKARDSTIGPALWRGQFSWIDPDHLRGKYADASHPNEALVIVLERRGVFSWKLIRLDLPLNEIFSRAKKH